MIRPKRTDAVMRPRLKECNSQRVGMQYKEGARDSASLHGPSELTP
jgi:hypothetical protein